MVANTLRADFCKKFYEAELDDEDLVLELLYAIQEGEISFYNVACKYIQDTELAVKENIGG